MDTIRPSPDNRSVLLVYIRDMARALTDSQLLSRQQCFPCRLISSQCHCARNPFRDTAAATGRTRVHGVPGGIVFLKLLCYCDSTEHRSIEAVARRRQATEMSSRRRRPKGAGIGRRRRPRIFCGEKIRKNPIVLKTSKIGSLKKIGKTVFHRSSPLCPTGSEND